ncbi:MAG: type III-A CRISPR-associated protein Csm2 [Spirochaetales bacterium]|nr:type III-A CRISPR-associated protein Csm2 [Spirochaetales bacterium]
MTIELTEKYLTTDAEKAVKNFFSSGDILGQIRKFYDDFKIIERQMLESKENDKEENFRKKLLPRIQFVRAKIAYAAGRKKEGNKPLIPREFKEYMDREIKKIQTREDFKNFLLHYQAIIAYYRYTQFEKEMERKGKNDHNQSHFKRGGNR